MEVDWNTTDLFNVTEQNVTDVPSTTRPSGSGIPQWYESGKIQIPLYAVIFMLAVVGNTLVILTLVSVVFVFLETHISNFLCLA